jgi:hypothetical protein
VGPPLSYLGFNGTSAAAPLVAGTCALMYKCLGADADLKMLRTSLVTGAVQPAATLWDQGWGFGYLQAKELCGVAPGLMAAHAPERDWDLEPKVLPESVLRIETQMTPLASESGAYTTEIELVGTRSPSAVEIRARRGLTIEIELPFLCVRWRRASELEELRRARKKRPLFRTPSTSDPLASIVESLGGREAEERLDVHGVLDAVVKNGRVRLRCAPGARVFIERLRVASGARVKMRVSVRGAARGTQENLARVAQFSEGSWRTCILLRPGAQP